MTKPVLAIDVYGTLIDTASVVAALRDMVGPEQAVPISDLWRAKQLEYSFRRGLMRRYVDFAVCTRQALDYALTVHGVTLSDARRESLLEAYRHLPAFDDVGEALRMIRAQGVRAFAFSNGLSDAVTDLLREAGVLDLLDGVVSVHDVGSFKPNPDVYAHFLRQAGAETREVWLISGNPFDVIGAIAADWRAIWVRRTAHAAFDPWEFQPTHEARGLADVPALIG